MKAEIVTIGDPTVDPRDRTGIEVDPADWDALIADPDVLLIDVRNSYEIAAGTFAGSIDPGTESFGDFPDWVRRNLDPARHKRIAMFCTGGIRCEKASSFLLREGFEDVRQLKGGILGYLEREASRNGRWQGGCFVFDERVAVGPGLEPLPLRLCVSCDAVIDEETTASDGYEDGVSCPRCVGALTDAQKASARERQRQISLAARQAVGHKP